MKSKKMKKIIRLQSGMEVWSARDGVQWPSLQIIFVMEDPSGNEWPFAHVMVQSVELHDNLELCGWVGRVKQSFFSCSQYGPTKFSAHEHLPGDMQMPLFLQAGIQMAKNGMKNINIMFFHLLTQINSLLHTFTCKFIAPFKIFQNPFFIRTSHSRLSLTIWKLIAIHTLHRTTIRSNSASSRCIQNGLWFCCACTWSGWRHGDTSIVCISIWLWWHCDASIAWTCIKWGQLYARLMISRISTGCVSRSMGRARAISCTTIAWTTRIRWWLWHRTSISIASIRWWRTTAAWTWTAGEMMATVTGLVSIPFNNYFMNFISIGWFILDTSAVAKHRNNRKKVKKRKKSNSHSFSIEMLSREIYAKKNKSLTTIK